MMKGGGRRLVGGPLSHLGLAASGLFVPCPYERRIVVYKVWQEWIRVRAKPRLLLSCNYRVGKSDQSVAGRGLWES
jgi:hypothetical protein